MGVRAISTVVVTVMKCMVHSSIQRDSLGRSATRRQYAFLFRRTGSGGVVYNITLTIGSRELEDY
jgi:hypothetical protein